MFMIMHICNNYESVKKMKESNIKIFFIVLQQITANSWLICENLKYTQKLNVKCSRVPDKSYMYVKCSRVPDKSYMYCAIHSLLSNLKFGNEIFVVTY